MLTIKIFSFSYKKSGIPKDTTPNGGGFVFDCRCIQNPGRIAEFIDLTGKDKKVIDFLDSNSDMQAFLNNVCKIIERVIENYTKRGFTDLMVCFGCTGGQHRSVYASEKLNLYLKTRYNNSLMTELHHLDIPN